MMNRITLSIAIFLGLALFSIPSEAFLGKKKESEFIKVVGKNLPPNKRKPPAVSKDRPVVVISIDGGGVRGIIPTIMIDKIEKALRKDITKVGDVFTGTSAGSIVIGLLNIPGKDGKPLFTGEKALIESTKIIKEIFHNSAKRTIRTLGGLAGSKYSAKPLEKYLKEYAKTTTVGNTIKPVVITSVDITTNKPYIFSTFNAIKNPPSNNLPLWIAIRASTAAPTYFKPIGIETVDEEQYRLVDGGLVANNPEMLGLFHATALYPKHKKFIVISLATGKPAIKRKIPIKGNNAGSLFQMLKPTIEGSLDSQADLSSEMMALMTAGKHMSVEYHRINVEVPKACAALDNASDKNLACLKKVALERVEQSDFQNMVASLKRVTTPQLASHRAVDGDKEEEEEEDEVDEEEDEDDEEE